LVLEIGKSPEHAKMNMIAVCGIWLFATVSIMLIALLYLSLMGAYLLVVPGFTYFYLKQRWYVAGSLERSFMYFLVFFFFPGLLLLSPFLNFRPQRRSI
jgi:NAD(P)H-quinone oxidoreductase subunit L